MWTKIVTVLGIILGLSACAPTNTTVFWTSAILSPKRKSDMDVKLSTSPAAPVKNIKPSNPISLESVCDTEKDTSVGAIVQRRTVQIRRENQRVIRKGCSGELISDKVETVKSPVQEIELKPTVWTGFRKTRVSVYNRTTCSGSGIPLDQILNILVDPYGNMARSLLDGIWNSAGLPSLRLQLDTSPSVGHMHVRRTQENFIDYEFLSCEKEGKDAQGKAICLANKSEEKGTLVVSVDYSEVTLAGTLEKVDCRK